MYLLFGFAFVAGPARAPCARADLYTPLTPARDTFPHYPGSAGSATGPALCPFKRCAGMCCRAAPRCGTGLPPPFSAQHPAPPAPWTLAHSSTALGLPSMPHLGSGSLLCTPLVVSPRATPTLLLYHHIPALMGSGFFLPLPFCCAMDRTSTLFTFYPNPWTWTASSWTTVLSNPISLPHTHTHLAHLSVPPLPHTYTCLPYNTVLYTPHISYLHTHCASLLLYNLVVSLLHFHNARFVRALPPTSYP